MLSVCSTSTTMECSAVASSMVVLSGLAWNSLQKVSLHWLLFVKLWDVACLFDAEKDIYKIVQYVDKHKDGRIRFSDFEATFHDPEEETEADIDLLDETEFSNIHTLYSLCSYVISSVLSLTMMYILSSSPRQSTSCTWTRTKKE